MAERKKVDKKRRTFENEIEVYKKNNKALCDMLTLYIYFVDKKNEDPAVYIALNEVIKDLEDKDVDVPFEAESIMTLMDQDNDYFYNVLRDLKESNYYDELVGTLYENYRIIPTRIYYGSRYINNCGGYLSKQPYNFFARMCNTYPDFVSEVLCSNMEMAKKLNILYDILKYYLRNYGFDKFVYILDPKGSGYELSRTDYKVKEQKINELLEAFRKEIETNKERKKELLEIILKINTGRAVDWLCYLQEQKLVDFMSERRIMHTTYFAEVETSLCMVFGNQIENLKKLYQLEDYNKLPENIRANDDKVILSSIKVEDITSFIALPNYKTSIVDIELLGKRVLNVQVRHNRAIPYLIDQIKSAIIHKVKDKEEYKTYCELASMFEQLADYKAYKTRRMQERIEHAKAQVQEERKLLNARYEFILRLSNMNESLQEQVPGKRVIKELVFQKENQDE